MPNSQGSAGGAAVAAKAAQGGTPASGRLQSSLAIFRKFLAPLPMLNEQGETMFDASRITSRECYEEWLRSRGSSVPTEPEKTFQRILTAHLTASDGRRPFSKEEELAILKVVRLKLIWPAFVNTSFTIGCKGFRSQGHHEKAANTAAGGDDDNLMRMDSFESVSSRASVRGPLPPSPPQPTGKLPRTDDGDYISVGKFMAHEDMDMFDLMFPSASASPAASAAAPSMGPPPPMAQSLPQASAQLQTTAESETRPAAPSLTLNDAGVVPKCALSAGLPLDPRVAEMFNAGHVFFTVVLSALIHNTLPELSLGGQPLLPQTPPLLDDAVRAMEAFERKFPSHAVVALNIKPASPDELVLAQNSASIPYLGYVAKSTGKQEKFRALVPEEHFIHFFKHVIFSVRNPGQVITFSCCILGLRAPMLLRLVMSFDTENGGVLVVGGQA